MELKSIVLAHQATGFDCASPFSGKDLLTLI
jgi:hypothetical protein